MAETAAPDLAGYTDAQLEAIVRGAASSAEAIPRLQTATGIPMGTEAQPDLSKMSEEDLLLAVNRGNELNANDIAASMIGGVPIAGPVAMKAAALIDAATYPMMKHGSSAKTIAERYAENRKMQDARAQAFGEMHPALDTALGLTSALLGTAPLAATKLGAAALGVGGKTLAQQVARGAAAGGGISALDAAVRGENPLTAGIAGAVLGGSVPAAARGIGAGVTAARNVMTPTPMVPQNIGARIAGVDLPLTGGEAAGDLSAMQREWAAKKGEMGAAPQRVAQDFFDARAAAQAQAQEAMKAGMSPTGTVQAAAPQDAGDIVQRGINAARQRTQANVQNLYGAVPNTQVPAGHLVGMGLDIKKALANAGIIVSDKLTPAASGMLDHIDEAISRLNVQNKAAPMGPATTLSGVDMKTIDQFRKELSSFRGAASNDTDRRATKAILDAFDKHIDVVAPSPELKAARAAHANYRDTFFRSGAGDTIGSTVEAITGTRTAAPLTPGEVADRLFNQGGRSAKLVSHLQTILQPEEWAALKQGLLSRVIEPPAGAAVTWEAQKVANRISDFLSGKGSDLAKAAFSAAERNELNNFASYLKKTIPPAGAVSYGSAPLVGRILRGAIGPMLGGITHGPLGAIAGYMAQPGIAAIKEGLAARSTARSLYGAPKRALPPASADYLIRALQAAAPGTAVQINRNLAGPEGP